jgi:hypothetical protein
MCPLVYHRGTAGKWTQLLGVVGAYGLTYDHPTSTKNKEADAGNPNVNMYHSIEDLQDDRKVEHLYDEIKQKEGQGK